MEMTVLELWPTDPVAACKRIYFDMYEIRSYVVRSLSACSSEYLKQQGVGTSGDTEAAAAFVSGGTERHQQRESSDHAAYLGVAVHPPVPPLCRPCCFE